MKEGGKTNGQSASLDVWRFLLRREVFVQNLVEHVTHGVDKLMPFVHLALICFTHNTAFGIACKGGHRNCEFRLVRLAVDFRFC